MAADIGATISLKGEKQYREQMREITQSMKTMRAETQQLDSAWKTTGGSQELAAKKVETLNKQIALQEQNVRAAEANVERCTEAYGENSRETQRWKQILAESRTELDRLNNELNEVPNGLQIMGQNMQTAGQKIKSVGKGMETAGKGLSKYVTAPIVGLGTLAVKTTADFDTSMSNVRAISGATGEEFEALRNKAREMGATTKYSASEAADSLGFMALAGWDADQMIDGLDGVLNLAAASGMDLAEASDLVTDYLSAFGLEASDASRMADELAYAQANSNTTTTQLGEAFGNSAAQMHAAGQSMETTTAILEAFANQGLKGSEAGTALSAMMRDMTQKMKDGKIYIGDTAVQVQDANGNFRDMTDILADVESATEGMGSAEKTTALMATFTARSIKGVNMVMNEGAGSVKKYRDELYKADGTAKSMADIMQDNLAGQLKILSSQLQELAISFGDILVPHVRKAVEWIQKQVDKFNSLDDATKEQIVKFAGLAAAIGPVLLVGGKLVSSVGSIVEGGGKLISWLGRVAPGFSTLLSVMGPVAGVFGLTVGAGLALGTVLKEISEYYGFTSNIQEFNEYVLGTADAASKARDNLEKSTEELKATHENAEKAMQEAEASGKITDKYAEQLYDLAGKSELTADEQRKLEVIVSKLNGIYPGFTEAVLDSNGSLKMGVDELKAYVGQLKEMQRIKAMQGIVEAISQKMTDAMVAQMEAEDALTEAQEAATAATEKQNAVIDKSNTTMNSAEAALRRYQDALASGADPDELAQLWTEYEQAMASVGDGFVELEGEVVSVDEALLTMGDDQSFLNNELDETSAALDENQKAYDEASKEYDKWNERLQDALSAIEGNIEATEEGTDATAENAEAVGEAGEAYADYADDIDDAADEIEEANKKIIESYEQTKKSAKDSIMGQKSLWEELEEQESTSIEKMRTALQQHHQALSSWNSNATSLISSTEYMYDEGFRNMVNTVIQGGEDLAPELQVIYETWLNNKEGLAELIADYGYTDADAERQAEILAYAETVAEHGLENVNRAFTAGIDEGKKSIEKKVKNPADIVKAVKEGLNLVRDTGKKLAIPAGKSVGEGVGKGIEDGKGSVISANKVLNSETVSGIADIIGLAIKSVEAGGVVPKGIAAGILGGQLLVTTALTTIKTSVSGGITNISNLQTSAKSAGTSVINNLKSGLKTPDIVGAMSEIKSSVKSGIDGIDAKKSDAKTAGTNIGTQLVAGLDGQQSSVTAAGRRLGDAAANGVGGAEGNAQANGRKVINAAADELKKYEGSQEPRTWGRHMGDNFANGLGSAYGNVVAQARQIANAVQNILGHSTPKEGPLKNDDVWGLHLGQNFAKGMQQAIPEVESAALQLADAAAMIPTATTLDIDAVTGRNVTETLTPTNIMDAFMAAAENIDWRVMIGNREFGRILREQGVYA